MSNKDLSDAIIQSLETHVLSLSEKNKKLELHVDNLHGIIEEILQNNCKTDKSKDKSENEALSYRMRQNTLDFTNPFSQSMNRLYIERNENDKLKKQLEEESAQNAILLNQLKSPKFNQIFSSTKC